VGVIFTLERLHPNISIPQNPWLSAQSSIKTDCVTSLRFDLSSRRTVGCRFD